MESTGSAIEDGSEGHAGWPQESTDQHGRRAGARRGPRYV